MATITAGILALGLLIIYKTLKDDPLPGMASALFWMIFAGACFLQSNGADPTNIYFYMFFAGLAMTVAMLLDTLAFSPMRARKREELEERKASHEKYGNAIDEMRVKSGMRPLRRE